MSQKPEEQQLGGQKPHEDLEGQEKAEGQGGVEAVEGAAAEALSETIIEKRADAEVADIEEVAEAGVEKIVATGGDDGERAEAQEAGTDAAKEARGSRVHLGGEMLKARAREDERLGEVLDPSARAEETIGGTNRGVGESVTNWAARIEAHAKKGAEGHKMESTSRNPASSLMETIIRSEMRIEMLERKLRANGTKEDRNALDRARAVKQNAEDELYAGGTLTDRGWTVPEGTRRRLEELRAKIIGKRDPGSRKEELEQSVSVPRERPRSGVEGPSFDFGFAEDAWILFSELSRPAREFAADVYTRAQESVSGAVKRANIKLLSRGAAMFDGALLRWHAMRGRPYEQRHKEARAEVSALQESIQRIDSEFSELSPAVQGVATKERQKFARRIGRLQRRQDRWEWKINYRNDKKAVWENDRKDIARDVLDTVTVRLAPIEARKEVRETEYKRIVAELERATGVKNKAMGQLGVLEKQYAAAKTKTDKAKFKEGTQRAKRLIKDVSKSLLVLREARVQTELKLASIKKKAGKWEAVRNEFTRMSRQRIDYYHPTQEDVGAPDLGYTHFSAGEGVSQDLTEELPVASEVAEGGDAQETMPSEGPTGGEGAVASRVVYNEEMIRKLRQELRDGTVGEPEMFEATTEDGVVFRVGELVQWESGGAYQFETPQRIQRFDTYDGKPFAFFAGKKSGVPVKELSKIEHGKEMREQRRTIHVPTFLKRWKELFGKETPIDAKVFYAEAKLNQQKDNLEEAALERRLRIYFENHSQKDAAPSSSSLRQRLKRVLRDLKL